MLEDGFLWMDFHFAPSYAMEFYCEFPYKINENTKTFSNRSLPEDGLNTRNRAGNDSKQQAYTHATVFKPNNFSIKYKITKNARKYK